jgi:hypothetical protein
MHGDCDAIASCDRYLTEQSLYNITMSEVSLEIVTGHLLDAGVPHP